MTERVNHPAGEDRPRNESSASETARARAQAHALLHEIRVRLARGGAPRSPEKPLVSRVRELLGQSHAEADPRTQELRSQLRNCVLDYARLLHSDGVPPEQMLVLVKRAVLEGPPWANSDEEQKLLADVVRWSVEGYYETGH